MNEVTIDAKSIIWIRVFAGKVADFTYEMELHVRETAPGQFAMRVCKLNNPEEIDGIDPHWLAAYALLQKAQQ